MAKEPTSGGTPHLIDRDCDCVLLKNVITYSQCFLQALIASHADQL